MKIKKTKNGTVTMTATNKKDSLNLLKFMTSLAGNEDPERKSLIERLEGDLENENSDLELKKQAKIFKSKIDKIE